MFKNFLDDFYDVLFRPQKGIRRVAEERTIWQGLAIYLGISIILSLSTLNVISPQDFMRAFSEAGFPVPAAATETLSWSLPAISLIANIVFGPLIFFLWVAIINFIAELFNGKGNAGRLGAAFGYAQFPYVFVSAVSLFGRYTTFNIVNLAVFAAFVWSVVLKIIAVREAHHFSTGRAVIIYFLPAIALVVALFIFFMLFIVFLMPSLAQFFEPFSASSALL